LNENQDTSTGELKSTFAAAKASKGPASDRISDEIALFQNFMIHDFWSAIFFLKSSIGKFAKTLPSEEVVGFKKKEPVIETVQRRPEELIEINFPTTENIDIESRSRGLLGVKHGNVNMTLGISNSSIASKIGFNYFEERLRDATEKEMLPDLVIPTDDETYQERTEGEVKKDGNKEKDSKGGKGNKKDSKAKEGDSEEKE